MSKKTSISTKKDQAIKSGRKLAANTAILAMSMMPLMAEAKISDWFASGGNEVVTIVKWFVIMLGAAGIAFAGFGVVSAIMAKKNRQPLEYQGYFIGGGVVCILLIPFVVAMGGSMSGSEDTGTIMNSTLNGGTTPSISIPR